MLLCVIMHACGAWGTDIDLHVSYDKFNARRLALPRAEMESQEGGEVKNLTEEANR